MSEFAPSPLSRSRLFEINLDQATIARKNPNVEHEREVAIFDILESNEFKLVGHENGPYRLDLSIAEDRLVLTVGNETELELETHALSLQPFKKIIKDYFLVCDSYYGPSAPHHRPRSRRSMSVGAVCTTRAVGSLLSGWMEKSMSISILREDSSR